MLGEWQLEREHVQALARGAQLLGAGGGGDPRFFAILAGERLRATPVTVVDADRLPQDGLVVTVAMLGSPLMMGERIPEGGEFVTAVDRLAVHLGEEPVAVMPLEAAGVNVFPPLLVAAELGLPVLDIDGMGRAFPRLDQTTFCAFGQRATPMTVTGSPNEVLLIDVADSLQAERLARVSLTTLGGWGVVASFPMTVAAARRTGLHGGLRRSLQVGRLAATTTEPRQLIARLGGQPIAEGRVLTVDRSDDHGPCGSAVVEPGADRASTLRLDFQNEYLVATLDGVVAAVTPDLIVVLSRHGLTPIGCDALRRGDDVVVFWMPVDALWQQREARRLVDAAAFGYPELRAA